MWKYEISMDKYIPRAITPEIERTAPFYSVILVTGARQVGKTTLCRHLYPEASFINLEDSGNRTLAVTDPNYLLDSLGSPAIIDEVQNAPELLSSIQVRVDADPSLKYILTGSSNFSLMQKTCQSLAGRVAAFTLTPFSFKELGTETKDISTDDLLWQGAYPGVICKHIPEDIFYRNYFNTYIERDVRDLLKVGNLSKFDTFCRLLAGRCGSEVNVSALATEIGISSPTVSQWMSILETAYIIFPLRPYYSNISKRLTKMPKIYFYDTGLVCFLLGIETPKQLATHPLRGAIFENLGVSELMKNRLNMAKEPNLSFYREHSGREVDVLVPSPEGMNLYEIKAGKTFRPEFLANMKYLSELLKDKIKDMTLIYDGPSIGKAILNIREI